MSSWYIFSWNKCFLALSTEKVLRHYFIVPKLWSLNNSFLIKRNQSFLQKWVFPGTGQKNVQRESERFCIPETEEAPNPTMNNDKNDREAKIKRLHQTRNNNCVRLKHNRYVKLHDFIMMLKLKASLVTFGECYRANSLVWNLVNKGKRFKHASVFAVWSTSEY